MKNSKLEQCLLHLDNNAGIFDRRTRQKMAEEIDKMSKEELHLTEEELTKRIQSHIEEGIDKTDKFVYDTIKITKDKEELFVDRVTGKVIKNRKDVLVNWLDKIVGRNSADTRARTLKNKLVNDYDSLEQRFRTSENQRYKSLRNIEDGSAEETYIYKKVAAFTEELTPDKLTQAKIDSLLKGANELDRIAYSIIAYNGHVRQFANANGMAIKYNKNYVMKRRYDMGAINRMFGEGDKARLAFADYMMEKLNLEETFGKKVTPVQAKDKLMKLYDELKTGAAEQTNPLTAKEFSTARANSISRSLVYKNADTAYEAFRDLSIGGLRDQFEKNAKGVASNLARIEFFGYDSGRYFEEMSKHLNQKFPSEMSWRETSIAYRIKQAAKELSGSQNTVQTGLTDFTNAVKFTQGATKLHKAIVSAMMDAVEAERMVFYNEGRMFGGIANWLSAFKKLATPEMLGGMTKEQKQAWANDVGVIFNYISTGEGMRMAQGDLATTGSKITGFINKHGTTIMNFGTLLPMQTGVSKIASGNAAAASFARMIDATAGAKGANLKYVEDTMKVYGISQAEMKILSHPKMQRVSTWGSPILTGKSIRDSFDHIGAETIAKELGVKPAEVADAYLAIAEKYEAYLNDGGVRGTPTPELATKSLIPGRMSDDERVRAFSSIFSQFMDTPIAQAQNFMELVEKMQRVHDARFTKEALATPEGRAAAMAFSKEFAPQMAMFTMMSVGAYLAWDGVYSTIFNTESLIEKFMNGDEDARREAIFKALDRSSPVPFVFNMIESQVAPRYNETALSSFSGGPVTGLIEDTLKLMQPTGRGWGEDLERFAKRQGPQRMMPFKAFNNWVSDDKL
jgi:hypothetical protein